MDGVAVVPSNSLTTAAVLAANTPTTTAIQPYAPTFLAEGFNFTLTNGQQVATYSPAVLMFVAPDASGNLHIYGTSLSPATGTPTSTQISSFSSPLNPVGSNQASNICDYGQGQTNLLQPTTLFVVLHVAGSTGCGGSGVGDTWVVVHYTDSATTAPVATSLATTDIYSLYAPSTAALGGIVLYDPTSKNVYFYANDSFTSPTTLVSLAPAGGGISVVFDQTYTKSGIYSSAAYFSIQGTGAPPNLYQVNYTGTATKCFTGSSSFSNAVSDTTNFYFTDVAGSSGSTIYQESIGGCTTPTTLLSSPSQGYGLVGSNGALLVLSSTAGTFPSNTTALSTIPVGTTSSSVTALASFNGAADATMASPDFATPSGDKIFVSVTQYTVSGPTTAVHYSTEVLSPSSTTPLLGPTLNATFQGLISPFQADVFEITGITDTAGTYGGGTLQDLSISSLTTTPFKLGGSNFTFAAGNTGIFEGFSNTVGEGLLLNDSTSPATTTAYAFDQSKLIVVPITYPNSTLSAF